MALVPPGGLVRRTLGRHIALTVLVALVLAGLTSLGVWRYAEGDARRGAEKVAREIASAALVPMAQRDFRNLVGDARAALLHDLAPFLRTRMIERVKVFTVDDGTARIVFSDDPRVEGRAATLRPELAARLDRGEVVVQPVPDDAEHVAERSLPGERLEVFFGFRDAGGNDTLLEMYVPVSVGEVTRNAVAVLVPLVVAGLLLIGLATVPLSVALARRLERHRAEQRAVRDYGLAAAELTRRDLAQRLHDGVVPDLAGASLLLEGIHASGLRGASPSWELIARAQSLVADDVRRLRTLLDELVPADVADDPGAALRGLVEGYVRAAPGPVPDVEVDVAEGLEMSADAAVLVHRAAGELLRNALRHARATTVRIGLAPAPGAAVVLAVVDDGVGLAVDAPRRAGHVGLQLVRNVVRDNGGTVVVESGPGAGTAVRVTVPAALRSPAAAWAPREGERLLGS